MSNKKIGEICNVLSGYAFNSQLFTKNSRDTPVIRIRDILRGYTNTYTKEEFNEKYIVKKGDLLIGMDGEFNISPWNGPDGLLNQRVCKIWPSSNEVTRNYLLYCLPKSLKDIERATSFVTVKHLSVKTIKEIIIALPTIDRQKQISKTLDTASELLAMRKRQLTELDNLIKSTFYDMFGDPVENEKGWLVSPLREELYVKHGFAFQGEYFSNEGEYILLTPGNFYEEGGYRNRGDKQKYYRGKIPQEYILNKDDLLIAMTEQAPGLLGSPLIVPESNKFLHNQRLGLIVLKKYDISKLYIFHLFNHQNIRKLIHLQATGTKVRHTSPKKIENLMVPLPPTELQTHFANVVTKIEEKKALVKKAIDETQYLFDSLMSEYFE